MCEVPQCTHACKHSHVNTAECCRSVHIRRLLTLGVKTQSFWIEVACLSCASNPLITVSSCMMVNIKCDMLLHGTLNYYENETSMALSNPTGWYNNYYALRVMYLLNLNWCSNNYCCQKWVHVARHYTTTNWLICPSTCLLVCLEFPLTSLMTLSVCVVTFRCVCVSVINFTAGMQACSLWQHLLHSDCGFKMSILHDCYPSKDKHIKNSPALIWQSVCVLKMLNSFYAELVLYSLSIIFLCPVQIILMIL